MLYCNSKNMFGKVSDISCYINLFLDEKPLGPARYEYYLMTRGDDCVTLYRIQLGILSQHLVSQDIIDHLAPEKYVGYTCSQCPFPCAYVFSKLLTLGVCFCIPGSNEDFGKVMPQQLMQLI